MLPLNPRFHRNYLGCRRHRLTLPCISTAARLPPTVTGSEGADLRDSTENRSATTSAPTSRGPQAVHPDGKLAVTYTKGLRRNYSQTPQARTRGCALGTGLAHQSIETQEPMGRLVGKPMPGTAPMASCRPLIPLAAKLAGNCHHQASPCSWPIGIGWRVGWRNRKAPTA